MKTLRSYEMLDFLKERKYCSVEELMRQFKVSPATVHRDIAELTSKGLIQKIHGGVTISKSASSTGEEPSPEAHFSARASKETARKAVIAELALDLIEDGDIVFLDSSTTALHLARAMQRLTLSSLTVMTNSVHIIQEFRLFPQQFVLVGLGGNYNCQLNSLLGHSAVEGLKRMRIGKAFVSAVGADGDGLTTYHEDHAEFLRQALRLAKARHLLIDGTKFGRAGLFKFAELPDFDSVISDEAPPKAIAAKCRKLLLPK